MLTSKLLVIVLTSLSVGAIAYANPQLNNVSAGNASVTQTGTSTVINQTSQQAVINWHSFNINANESTHFQQPTGGVTLNRVNPSQGVSQIYGRLTSTGQIIISNPAGIHFGPNAYVNVGGIIATTATLSDENFMNGNYHFTKVDGYSGAVINEGEIFVATHGLAALVAPGVVNNGRIQAKLGHVVLASGDAFTVSFSDNNLISFSIDAKASQAGVDGQGNSLRDGVKNAGEIIASGGTIIISAKVAQGVLDNTINLQGVVEAKSVEMQNGQLIISGDEQSGVVSVAANIDVSGKEYGQTGGNVAITGYNVLIDTPSVIDVSGERGGGNIDIGGNYQGKGLLSNSYATVIAPNVMLLANATTQGNGGNVIVWSDYATKVYGNIQVQAGVHGGDGGFVETSSHHYLDISGAKVNASATHGVKGTWLLDPEDVYITSVSPTTGGSFNGANPNIFTPTSDDSNLYNQDIIDNLTTANVVITTGATGAQNGDIYVNAPITWSNDNSLTLSAYGSIILNSDITNTGNANVVLRSDNTGTGVGAVCGAGSAFCGGAATGVVNLTGGVASVYYNPSVFATQDVIYTGGTAPVAYMLVNNTTDLQNINLNSAEYYALGKNLDLIAISNFTPLNSFSGRFDGLNNTLGNLTMNDATPSAGFGLFSYTFGGAIISNLTLSNINFTLTGDGLNVGGLIGGASNTTIQNVSVDGVISLSGDINTQNTGGLIGNADNTTIISNVSSGVDININVDDIISGYSAIGGIVGFNNAAITDASFTTGGSITFVATANTSSLDLGGIAGYSNNAKILNVTNEADITVNTALSDATESIGGVIGNNYNNVDTYGIENAINDNTMTVLGNSVAGYRHIGGLVGVNSAAINNVSSAGNINVTSDIATSPVFDVINNNYHSGGENIGGLIGTTYNNGLYATIVNSTSTTDVVVNGNISGLFGFGSNATIGGFVGNNNTYIDNTVVVGHSSQGDVTFTGNISANSGINIGGFIGSSYTNEALPIYAVQGATSSGNVLINGDSSGGYVNAGSFIGGFAGSMLNVGSSGNMTVSMNGTTISQTIYNTNTNTYEAATANSGFNVGGFVGSYDGFPDNQRIDTATSSGNVSYTGVLTGLPNAGSYLNMGGFVGSSRGYITNVISSGAVQLTADATVNSGFSAGGFAGSSANYATAPNTFSTAYLDNITSTNNFTENQITSGISTNSYQNTGGFIGFNISTIQNVSYTGVVTLTLDISDNASSNIGGFVGFNERDGNNLTTNFGSITNAANNSVLMYQQAVNGLQTNANLTIGGFVGGNRGAIDQVAVIGPSTSNPITITTDASNSSINAGGFAGANYGSSGLPAGEISNAISNSSITVDQVNGDYNSAGLNIGGFVANNESFLTAVASNGKIWTRVNWILTTTNIGGMVANNNTTGIVYDSTTSSQIVLSGPGSTLSDLLPATFSGGQVFVGGLAASNNGYFDNCCVTGLTNTGSVTMVVSTNTSSGFTQIGIGGLFGLHIGSPVLNVSNGSDVNLIISNDGGLILAGGIYGFTLGPIADTTNTSHLTISGTNNAGLILAGGMAGAELAGVSTSYMQGTIDINIANSNGGIVGVGGLVGGSLNAGFGAPDITDSYSLTSLKVRGSNDGASTYVGGLVGANGVLNSPVGPLTGGAILNTYSAGVVDVAVNTVNGGETNVGGLVGYLDSTGILTDSFWDTAVTGQVNNVGGGTGVVSGGAGGCYDATSCANGGLVDLTQEATYSFGSPYISGAGWDFTTTWGIINGISYPYLQAFNPGGAPRYFYGTAPVGNVGQTVNLVINGVVAYTSVVAADNTFYFDIPNGDVADGTPLLIYINNNNPTGNLILTAPIADGSLNGLSFTANTLNIGFNQNVTLSNTDLANIVGVLTGNSILYSGLGSDLVLGNAGANTVNFLLSPATSYLIDGDINTFAGTTSTLTFNNAVTINNGVTVTVNNQVYNDQVILAGNATLQSVGNGSIAFNGTLQGNGNDLSLVANNSGGTAFTIGGVINNLNSLNVTGNHAADNLFINTNDQQLWQITGTNTGNVSGISGIVNNVLFSNVANLTGGSNDNTFAFDDASVMTGSIVGGSGSNNTLDYSAYTGAIRVTMQSNATGNVENNAGNFITGNFSQIANIIANDQGILQLPSQAKTIEINGAGMGVVNIPIHFAGFNTFIGNSRDKVVFNISPYTLDVANGTATYNGYVMYFINIPLGGNSRDTINLQQIVQATYVPQMEGNALSDIFTRWNWNLALDINNNLNELMSELPFDQRSNCVMREVSPNEYICDMQ